MVVVPSSHLRGGPLIDAKDLDVALRATFWPALKARGFSTRTTRVAWRYVGNHVDVVELQAVGQAAEAIGATPHSLSVFVAAFPPYLERRDTVPVRDGQLRPHYWHCDPFRQSLHKTLTQPWFRPFSQSRDRRTLSSIRLHREALKHLVDRNVHDRPEIWYMRDDGSNIDENVRDLTRVVVSEGLDLLAGYHDPRRVIAMIDDGSFLHPESSRAFYLRQEIVDYLASAASTKK